MICIIFIDAVQNLQFVRLENSVIVAVDMSGFEVCLLAEFMNSYGFIGQERKDQSQISQV